jgi:hypothetical protein
MKFMESRSQFRFLFSSLLVLSSTAAVFAQSAASVPSVAPSTAASTPAARSAPQITYVNGQLTISARDASLGDILRAVSTKTGAVIEFPSDRSQEHLFANAGPGPVREVLASLLNGSRFNYVMLASPTNPNILQRMILTSSEEPAATPAQEPLQSATVQPPPASAPPAEEIQKGLTPAAAAESAAIEQMEVPKDLSPDALEAMMKARREARKLQREQQSAASGSSQ